MPGDQNHRQGRVALLQGAQELHAIHPRHANVANNHTQVHVVELRQQPFGAATAFYAKAGQFEGLG